MFRGALAVLVVAGLSFALAACGSSSKSSSDTKPGSGSEITISNYKFTVPTGAKVGDKITVKNNDQFTHTVTADDKSFDSGNIAGGGTATITLTKSGAIAFHCNIHNFMTATINVAG